MKLIGSYTSPYVRKIRVMLLEKAVPCEFVNDSPWEASTHVGDYNPLCKVPALQTDDDEVLFDSPIVAEYIELLKPFPAFLPEERMAALRVRQIEALADGVGDAGVAVFMEWRRPADKQVETWIERQQGKVNRGLDALEVYAAKSTWLCGTSMSLADIAAGCVLGWIDYRKISPDWRTTRPALTALVERLHSRPSFVQTTPPAL